MSRFGTGQLASQAGVTIDSVRCYQRDGPLSVSTRLATGYRGYLGAERKRVRFIRRTKLLGCALAGIRSLLKLSAERSVARIKRVADARLTDVEQHILELECVRDGLRSLISARPGHGRAEAYRILNTLNEEDSP